MQAGAKAENRCLKCRFWTGKRTRDSAWCKRLLIGIRGDRVCDLFEKKLLVKRGKS